MKNKVLLKSCFVLIIGLNQLHAQNNLLPKPVEDIFEVVWSDTIKLESNVAEPLLNGNLIIPPLGNDGCYLAETGEILYYTFSPHQKIIRENCSSRYLLFKTEGFNIIFDIETGKEVYEGYYKETKDRTRNPYITKNKVITDKYICFASSLTTFSCVDTSTMQEKWVFESDYELYDNYLEHNQVVYLGSEKYIYAIDIETGKLKWETEVGLVKTNFLLEDNLLYAFIKAKGVVALRIKNGDIEFTSERISLFLSPRKLVSYDNILYFVDGKIHAVNDKNGTYIFETDDYETCTNTESFFIYKDFIFSQSCARNNYSLEGFDRLTGVKLYKASKEIENKQVEDFLNSAIYFSPPDKNMIFAISSPYFENRSLVARIYGVKIKGVD